ncbi:MAG: SDR family NAD(P)-dependent oxidoreductase [Alkalilacustris sp.]
MRDWAGKRYWLVGASEGLGRALAHRLSRVGCRLVLSARSAERLEALAAELPGVSEIVPMDVADMGSVRAAAAKVGDLGGLVFLSGVYWPFGAQEWDAEQAVTMADVNFTGALRVLGEVVPGMVARGQGHIVLTGSLAGFAGLPNSIGYGSSKAGLMHLASSMRCDLQGRGVTVQLANPGFIRTRLTDKNEFRMPFLMEPEGAADVMFRHMCGDSFSVSFPGLFSLLFRGANILPNGLHLRLFGTG